MLWHSGPHHPLLSLPSFADVVMHCFHPPSKGDRPQNFGRKEGAKQTNNEGARTSAGGMCLQGQREAAGLNAAPLDHVQSAPAATTQCRLDFSSLKNEGFAPLSCPLLRGGEWGIEPTRFTLPSPVLPSRKLYTLPDPAAAPPSKMASRVVRARMRSTRQRTRVRKPTTKRPLPHLRVAALFSFPAVWT